MNLLGSFEPSVEAYVRYCAVFLLRYFGVAGLIYAVLYVWFRSRWAARRI